MVKTDVVSRFRRANGASSIVVAMLLASCSGGAETGAQNLETDVAPTALSRSASAVKLSTSAPTSPIKVATPRSTLKVAAQATALKAKVKRAPSPLPRPVSTPKRQRTVAALDNRVPVVKGARAVLGRPPGAKVDRRPSRVAPPQQRFAVLVGVTNYRSPTRDTIGSAADAKLFQRMLLKAGWLPQNVRVLTDKQVTGKALRAQLAWLAARSRPGTFTLFHYSGHVKQRGGGREALWPVDRDFVDDTAVAAALGRGSGRMWVNIAGCEAGSFAGDLPSARVLFTGSSKATEKSYEYPRWGLSVWTGLLLDQGTRQRRADADRDGRVTVGESIRFARYYAQAITLTQRPYGRQTPVVLGDRELGWTLAEPPA